MATVVGMFETRAEAEAAIDGLNVYGVGVDAISVAMRRPEDGGELGLAESVGAHDMTEEGTAVGAVSGAAVGTIVGLLVAGSTFMLPGVGTFLIAGPLASALTGAGLGAASGGIVGALIGSGIPEPAAHEYLAGVQAGRVVVAAHVGDSQVADVRRIFDEAGSRRTHSV